MHALTKEQARAHRFVKHQHMVVDAIEEILEEDPGRYCKDLSPLECKTARDDKQRLINIIREIEEKDIGQGRFN